MHFNLLITSIWQ